MPPLVSDEESGGDDIPFKPAKANLGDEDVDEDEDDEDDEEGDEVDEYVIEDIVGHDFDGPTGEVLYHVKWEGYDDPADMTWEPEANLESAQDALKKYFKKVGGRPESKDVAKKGGPGGRKRKATDTPKAAAARSKRGKSETPEVSTKGRKKKRGAAMKEEKEEKGEKNEAWKLPKGSWEDQVASIDTIEEALDEKGNMQRFVYVLWDNGNKTRHQLATVNQKCPQKMLQYYESHLVFRAPEASANGDAS